MRLKLLNNPFSVCRVRDISDINFDDEFVFIGKTDEELSLVCGTGFVPPNCLKCENGWRGFRVEGELDFSLVGILSDISGIMAGRQISIFALSTYNTDYILIKEDKLEQAVEALSAAGYEFDRAV